MMDDVNELYGNSLDQLSDLLSADNVIGEAVQTEHGTVIPLLSAGFGFGAGAGKGGPENAEGGGAGAGGGIKPVAVIIIAEGEIRVERLADSSIWGRVTDAATRIIEQRQRQQGNEPVQAGGSSASTSE